MGPSKFGLHAALGVPECDGVSADEQRPGRVLLKIARCRGTIWLGCFHPDCRAASENMTSCSVKSSSGLTSGLHDHHWGASGLRCHPRGHAVSRPGSDRSAAYPRPFRGRSACPHPRRRIERHAQLWELCLQFRPRARRAAQRSRLQADNDSVKSLSRLELVERLSGARRHSHLHNTRNATSAFVLDEGKDEQARTE